MHTGHAPEFTNMHPDLPQNMDTSSGPADLPTPASPDNDDHRGRRRDRDELDADENSSEKNDGEANGSSRKRRRSRKSGDKKFLCPHEGCGKSYSRAEHLYRHQLNRMYSISPALAPVLNCPRQPQANLPLRLPRLPPILRPTRLVRPPQGETYRARLAITTKRHLHAEHQSHRDGSYGQQERHSQQAWTHEELSGTPKPVRLPIVKQSC
jgi:hypothetical protein